MSEPKGEAVRTDAIDWTNDEAVVRAAIGGGRSCWGVYGNDPKVFRIWSRALPGGTDPQSILLGVGTSAPGAWKNARTEHPSVVAYEAQHSPAEHLAVEGAPDINRELWTAEKAIARLNEIHKDVQGQIHDGWDWMDAAFCVEVLRCAIEDASLPPEAPQPAYATICDSCGGDGTLGVSKDGRLISCEACGGHEDSLGLGYIVTKATIPEAPEGAKVSYEVRADDKSWEFVTLEMAEQGFALAGFGVRKGEEYEQVQLVKITTVESIVAVREAGK